MPFVCCEHAVFMCSTELISPPRDILTDGPKWQGLAVAFENNVVMHSEVFLLRLWSCDYDKLRPEFQTHMIQ